MPQARTILVLGAGDGLGGAIARRFAREGFHAAVVRRKAQAGSWGFRFHCSRSIEQFLYSVNCRRNSVAVIPRPRVLHPWPNARFAVKHPRQEPYAGIPLVRICAGGAG